MALHVAAHHPAVLTGLLLCGLAVLLVLTLTARDLQQPPGFMVGSCFSSGFGSSSTLLDPNVTLWLMDFVEKPCNSTSGLKTGMVVLKVWKSTASFAEFGTSVLVVGNSFKM